MSDTNVKLIGKDATFIRKQIRNVLQETGKEIIVSEATKEVENRLIGNINSRLDGIEKFCQESLQSQDKRIRGVLGFVIQEVVGKISNDLLNAQLTLDATIAVLADSGINIPDLKDRVDAKKSNLRAEKEAAAGTAMQKDMEARNAAEPSQEPTQA